MKTSTQCSAVVVPGITGLPSLLEGGPMRITPPTECSDCAFLHHSLHQRSRISREKDGGLEHHTQGGRYEGFPVYAQMVVSGRMRALKMGLFGYFFGEIDLVTRSTQAEQTMRARPSKKRMRGSVSSLCSPSAEVNEPMNGGCVMDQRETDGPNHGGP